MRRTGRFWWLTLASATAPLLGLIPFTQLTLESAEWQKWLDIMPIGLGLGSATTSALIALISGVDRSEMAVATAASYLSASQLSPFIPTTTDNFGPPSLDSDTPDR